MKKEELQQAEYLLSALNKANFSVTGVELIQFARGFEWLAKEIHETKNPPMPMEKMEIKEEPKKKEPKKKQKLKG